MEITNETKWTATAIGPRQVKAFNEAISRYSWESRTITEVTDHGESNVTPMFGPVSNAAAGPMLLAIKQHYEATVTGKNYMHIVADIQAAMVKLRETRPVVDTRTTPEQRAERERIAIEYKAKEEAKAARLAALSSHEYSLADTAKAVKRVLTAVFPATTFSVKSESYSMGCSIDAHWTDGPTSQQVKPILDIFQCCGFDGMEDMKTYNAAPEWNGHRFVFRGDYVKGNRSVSGDLLYDCAERFMLETGIGVQINLESPRYPYVERDNALCGWSLHTLDLEENPGGQLSRDECSTWTAADIITQMTFQASKEAAAIEFVSDWPEGTPEPANSLRAIVFRILLGQISAPAAPIARHEASEPATVTATGITVRENNDKDGIEVRFESKPASSVLDSLKANGWRWSKFSKCWYHKRTTGARAFADKLAGVAAAPVQSQEDYPCTDIGYEDACARACGEGL